MENNKNKKSMKFQGDVLNFCDFIQVFVFTPNHHLNGKNKKKIYFFFSENTKNISSRVENISNFTRATHS